MLRLWYRPSLLSFVLFLLMETGRLPVAAQEVEIRAEPVTISQSPRKEGFTSISSAKTQVDFIHQTRLESSLKNRFLEDGSGVAIGDVNGDGWADLYLCQGEGPNQLYMNQGAWTFTKADQAGGAALDDQFSTGAALADLDGDLDLDLLVNGIGVGSRLFLNRGDGTFSESADPVLRTGLGARSFAIADIDEDGDLDVYVTHYRRQTVKDQPIKVSLQHQGGKFIVPEGLRDRFVAEAVSDQGVLLIELGEPDLLLRNRGDATFESVSWTQGSFLDVDGNPLTEPPADWGLSALFFDYNRDGRPDLYVCNDFYSPDRFWVNQGGGIFRELSREGIRKTSWASMAVDVSDIDCDGYVDLFVADMLGGSHRHHHTQRTNLEQRAVPSWGWGWARRQEWPRVQTMRNTLLRQKPEGDFEEIAWYSGLAASDWTWGAIFLDVDLDGYDDLLIANGHARDFIHTDHQREAAKASEGKDPLQPNATLEIFPPLNVPNQAYRNLGNLRFEEVGQAWGFDWVGVSNGMALGDLDNDGDQDLVLNNHGQAALLYRNETSAPRIRINLQSQTTPFGIGARLEFRARGRIQSHEILSGGRYLSSDQPTRTFAFGKVEDSPELTVLWPSGRRSVYQDLLPNHLYHITEPQGEVNPATPRIRSRSRRSSGIVESLFQDVSQSLGHRSIRTAVMPNMAPDETTLWEGGPSVGWSDLNGDGRDDLWIGGAPEEGVSVYMNLGADRFQNVTTPYFGAREPFGWGGIVSAMLSSGETLGADIRLANPQTRSSRIQFWKANLSGVETIQTLQRSDGVYGSLALGDCDRDGDLDALVLAARTQSGLPAASSVLLLRQENGRWEVDEENRRVLSRGMPGQCGIWTDWDGDGDLDVILAGHWSPIRLFRNGDGGRLVEVTEEWGLSETGGWWNGLASGDFNGDGLMDFIATNWGLNHSRADRVSSHLTLYWDQEAWDQEGMARWFEGYQPYQDGVEYPWTDWGTLSKRIPEWSGRFETMERFASATIQDLDSTLKNRWKTFPLKTFATTCFINRGSFFEAIELPREAQMTPASGVSIADWDGDGHEDLFLAQNEFGGRAEDSRWDDGRGLILMGLGDGKFRALSSVESGVKISGEQRSSAVADYDEDGCPDVLVSVVGEETRLFRNRLGKPGLRVRFQWKEGNLGGIGAKVRVLYQDGAGPVRELRAGTGCWGHDSSTVVLAKERKPIGLWVQGPDGKEREIFLKDLEKARGITILVDGRVVTE